MAVPGGWLCKVDVRSYFHHFGVFPEHWPLLAFNMPLADGSLKEVWGSRMLFGLRNGPEVATRSVMPLSGCYVRWAGNVVRLC
eukprot:jgi/Chrzof1/5303/Cz15g21140.t1